MTPTGEMTRTGERSTPQELVERALQVAGSLAGVSGAAVLVEQTSHVDLRWAMNSLTTNGVSTGWTVSVAVITDIPGGQAVGTVSRPAVGVDELADLVTQALGEARQNGPAEDAAALVPGVACADWADPAGSTGPATLKGVSTALAEVFARCRAEQRESFGYASHDVVTTWLGTSTGIRYRHEQPTGTVELNGKAADRTRSAFHSQATRDFRDVDLSAIDSLVRTRLGWQARTVELPAGRYDTVLPPTAVADLMIYLYWSSEARAACEGRSVFSRPGGGTLVGDRITPVELTLGGDPAAAGLQCAGRVLTGSSGAFASVFDNGMATPAVNWVSDGVLTALPNTRHSAALAGLPVTPAVDNLIMSGGQAAGRVEDLVAGLERGLLLTCLWYIREVDPVTLLLTGLTRDGVYLVEGGEVVGAAPNFRFNESPVDVLRRVRQVSQSELTLSREWSDWFTRTSMPGLLVSDFNMSSVSQAS